MDIQIKWTACVKPLGELLRGWHCSHSLTKPCLVTYAVSVQHESNSDIHTWCRQHLPTHCLWRFFVKLRAKEEYASYSLHLLLVAPNILTSSLPMAHSQTPFPGNPPACIALAHTYTISHLLLSWPLAMRVIVAGWPPLDPHIFWSPLPDSFSFIHAQLSVNGTTPSRPLCHTPVLLYQSNSFLLDLGAFKGLWEIHGSLFGNIP